MEEGVPSLGWPRAQWASRARRAESCPRGHMHTGSGGPRRQSARDVRLRSLSCLVLTAVLAVLTPRARAQEADAALPDASDEVSRDASSHFRRGVELFQEGAYRAAIVEFNRA